MSQPTWCESLVITMVYFPRPCISYRLRTGNTCIKLHRSFSQTAWQIWKPSSFTGIKKILLGCIAEKLSEMTFLQPLNTGTWKSLKTLTKMLNNNKISVDGLQKENHIRLLEMIPQRTVNFTLMNLGNIKQKSAEQLFVVIIRYKSSVERHWNVTTHSCKLQLGFEMQHV